MSEEKDDLKSIKVTSSTTLRRTGMSLPLSSESLLIVEATMELLMALFLPLTKEKQ